MPSLASWASIALTFSTVLACGDDGGSCSGPQSDVVLTRHVKRMQPDAQGATTGPKGPLEWGQINFLQTTDTHGWLEGHLKEKNYGADWGDFVSFSRAMKEKARGYGVDLLLVDTGDLHDGAGISDATDPNGIVSNPIFENVDYDLLTIGNHELYVSSIAYEHFGQFAMYFGDRYVNSNVKIYNPNSKMYETPGVQYRYFTTEQGLRIMAFGVLFDFTGNSNASQITKARDMVTQTWFKNAVDYKDPIDLFVVFGHNPVRANASTCTLSTVYKAIRAVKPDTPIQMFGGHTHIRDFVVYDNKATGLEAGRYCETLGWVAINGIDRRSCLRKKLPADVPRAAQPAIFNAVNDTSTVGLNASSTDSKLRYARRYLDWNRRTFAYHATGSQDGTFDTGKGKVVSNTITNARNQLNLTSLYGCAPRTYCQYCKPVGDPGNIYTLIPEALSATVINEQRKNIPHYIIVNSGHIRFDLVQGPFTYDDSFIVSPFKDAFQYLKDVPYAQASQILAILNAGPYQKRKRDLSTRDMGFTPLSTLGLPQNEECVDPLLTASALQKRALPRISRRQTTTLTPGYTTLDDFGSTGDDTLHSRIPSYKQPNDVQATVSFPTDGSTPATVDVVFLDFIASYVINALNSVGGKYSTADVTYYVDQSFTTNSYFQAYAQLKWRGGSFPNCPVGEGVGGS